MTEQNNYWIRILNTRMSRRKALAAMGVGIGYAGLAASGCSSGRQASLPSPLAGSAGASPTPSRRKISKVPYSTAQPKYGGTFRYPGSNPPHFDLYQTSTTLTDQPVTRVVTPLTTVHHGPQYEDGDRGLEPWTAEGWEQPDATTYIFHIRKGMKFANVPPVNGRELTADDVKFSLQRAIDPTTGNPEMRYRVEDIKSIDTPDKYTVKITLGQPVVDFLLWTSGVPFLVFPHEAIDKYGDLKKPESLVGAGPWILDKYEPSVTLNFRKNPDFFMQGKPYLDRLEIPLMNDNATRLAAYRSGKLDNIPLSPSRTDLASLLQTNPDSIVDEFWATGMYRVSFSLDKPPFSDVRVRRAVALSFDYDGFNKALLSGAGQRVGPLTPGFAKWFIPFESDPSGKWYTYDPTQAKQLLAEAGYPNGFETTFTASNLATPPEHTDFIAASLSKIGIKTKIDMKEHAAWLTTAFVGKFEGITEGLCHYYYDPEYYLWGMFYPGNPLNHGNLNDPVLNKMLEQMKSELNETKRTEVIKDIQKRVRDNVYNISMPKDPEVDLSYPYVKNYVSMKRGFCVGNWGKELLEVWLDK